MSRRPSLSFALVVLVVLAGLALAPGAVTAAGEATPIEDNSFLIEEAYNQETRVVQHISTWLRPCGGGAWDLTFTQEWPVGGQRHQLSYTIPVRRLPESEGGARGVGDVGLNYRFQWLGVGGGPVAVATRLTALLASGDMNHNLGAGAPGLQVNLPLSVAFSPRWVAHTNAGATWIRADDGTQLTGIGSGVTPATRGVNLGQSLIWLPAPTVNLMLELAWERSEAPGVPGDADREEGLLLAPGLRWAHDFQSGLQIVPGIAAPIGIGPSRGERSLFIYLSFEHGF
jgi:hypothetical protein